MTIHLFSFLINVSTVLLPLALSGLLFIGTVGAGWWVVKRVVMDLIQLRGLWYGQSNSQVLAELQQKNLALELHHKGIMLEVEGDKARLPIKRERLELLALSEEK